MPHEDRLAWTQATLWLLLDEAYILALLGNNDGLISAVVMRTAATIIAATFCDPLVEKSKTQCLLFIAFRLPYT